MRMISILKFWGRNFGRLFAFLWPVIAAVLVVKFAGHHEFLIRAETGGTAHWLTNEWEGQGTVVIQNKFPHDSYSAFDFTAWDTPRGEQRRGSGMGYANPSTKGNVFDDAAFVEAYDLSLAPGAWFNTAPPPFRLVQTGVLDGIPGNHLRMEANRDGDIFFYQPGKYPDQKPEMELSRDGTVTVFGNLKVAGKIESGN